MPTGSRKSHHKKKSDQVADQVRTLRAAERRTHHATYGAPADMMVMHLRRQASLDYAGTLAATLNDGIANRLGSAEVPTIRWTGATNDAILMVSTSDVALYSNPVPGACGPRELGEPDDQAPAHQYAALHVNQPAAVTHIAGTLSAPSF